MSLKLEYTPELEQYLRSENIPVTGVLARDLILGGIDQDKDKLFNIAVLLGIGIFLLILYLNDYRKQSELKLGLPSVNNNCFLNSVMQQLRYTPHIEKLLEEKNFESRDVLSKNLYNFLKHMKTGNITSEELKQFRRSLEWKDDKDGNYIEQQDAFTLLQYIIDRNETNKKIKDPFKIGIPLNKKGEMQYEYYSNISYFTTNGNRINDINYNKEKLKELCDPFIESLSFDKKDFEINNDHMLFPKTIIITKGDNKNELDISDVIKLRLINDEKKYKLSGAIVRIGQTYKHGHYYSYVRNPKTELWTLFNDENVETGLNYKSIASDIKKNGYIFFYNFIEEPVPKTGGYEFVFYFSVIIFVIVILLIILLIFSQKIQLPEFRIFH